MAAMMPEAPMMDPAAEEAAPADLSQGYTIAVSVHGDGTFSVGEPEPLEAPAEADTGTGTFDGIAEALKAVISVVKANPVGGEQAAKQFDAGYAA